MKFWMTCPKSCQSGRDKGFPLHDPGGPQVWPPRQPSAHSWHRAPWQQLWVQGQGLCRHSSLCSLHLQQFGKILDVEIIFNERGSKVGDAHGQQHTASPREGVSGPRLPSSAVTCSAFLSCPMGPWHAMPHWGSTGTNWGGRAGPCTRHWREERARSVPPRAARVPLCLDVSVVSSLLSVPLSQTLLPAHGRFWGLSQDPRPLQGPQAGLFISALWQPHLLRQLS